MAKLIEIKCLNTQITRNYRLGTDLQFIANDLLGYSPEIPVLGAMVNHELKELSYEIYKPKTIKFIDIRSRDGMRMYIRSLTFVLLKSVRDLYPEASLHFEHSISKGFFCQIENINLDLQIISSSIRSRMQEIINDDIPFVRTEMLTEDAIALFESKGFTEKARLFRSRTKLYTSVYHLDNQIDYFYGHLVPSSGYLQVFDLAAYKNGMLLRIPKRNQPDVLEKIISQEKMFDVFQEHKKWVNILEVESIGSINQSVSDGKANELIKISEALQEKKLGHIGDKIKERSDKVKLVLISGPSSSGKTTFSKRLGIQLRVVGLKPIQISLDNYFVDREKTPRDENGEYDFESMDALDVKLFNQNLNDLMLGKEVEIPNFSFETGKRFYNGKTLHLKNENILIVEGIHGLNPKLTSEIDPEIMYKIYVSALTQVGIDQHNRISTTDNRLIRRIVRDFQYRGYSALDTLKRWSSVRRGEDKNIFPYQEEANIMFNSALIFELGVLKDFAEPLLRRIKQNQPEYAEAIRLLKFLSYFCSIKPDKIPPTSILREFLSGSSFKY